MFQASRNWPGLRPLAEAMSKNLAQPINKGDGQDVAETQGRLFREQFCVAAMRLADHLRESLPSAGILWDQILPTGTSLSSTGSQSWVAATPHQQQQQQQQQPDGPVSPSHLKEVEDLAEKGMRPPRHDQYSRGSLMFVVRRAQNDRDVERLSSIGYRFADIEQVSSTIASRMQIQSPGLEFKLRQMALYADQEADPDAGVHLGFFGIRARVGRSGFDVMVQRGGRHLLPSISLRLPKLEAWHVAFLRRFDGMSIMAMDRSVRTWTTSTTNERVFISRLSDGIQSLRDTLQDASLDNAVFSSDVVTVPSQSSDDNRTMVVFSIVVPIHAVAPNNPQYEFISLSLFKAHQLVRLHQSQVAFVQRAHRDCGALLQQYPRSADDLHAGKPGWMSRWRASKIASRHHHRTSSKIGSQSTDESLGRQTSSAGLSGSSSTVDLCRAKGDSEDMPSPRRSVVVRELPPMTVTATKGPYGGIMVSEVITVNVETRDDDEDGGRDEMTRTGSGRQEISSNSSDMEMDHLKAQKTNERIAMMTRIAAADEGEGQNTFVDDLFQKCVEARRWHG